MENKNIKKDQTELNKKAARKDDAAQGSTEACKSGAPQAEKNASEQNRSPKK